VRGPEDRRTAERFPVTDDTHCNFLSPVVEDFGPVKVRNVSTDGIGLLLSRKVEPGALLAVGLANTPKGFGRTVLVRVIHVTPQPGGSYLIGGNFNTPLTYEELRNLVM